MAKKLTYADKASQKMMDVAAAEGIETAWDRWASAARYAAWAPAG
jgi:hypothetical protein